MEINKSFKEWRKSELERYLGIKHQKNYTILQQWLSTKAVITEQEQFFLKKLCEVAVNYWNEQELRQRLITPLTWLVEFHDYAKQINFFAERKLSKTIKNAIAEIKLEGVVNWCVATGVININ